MAYNLTAVAANSTGFLSFTQGVNTVLLDDWLGIMLLISLSVIMMIAFMWATNDSSKSIAGTAFLSFSLGVLLRAMGLVSDLTLFITIIVSAAAIAVIWQRR